MITFLYTLGIYSYSLAVRLASLWNPKARLWAEGRKQIWQQLADFQDHTRKGRSVIWVHCASLGEFEQGRPVIEGLKARFPAAALALTFFSPSGYEVRKQYPHADLICYLPADTPGNARRFVAALEPELAIFVKYEFWRHHLHRLRRAGVPTLLVSAIFRPDQLFFKPYGFWYRRLLPLFQHIFVQDQASAALLGSIQLRNVSLAGDTRVDRVLQLQAQAPEFPEVARFTAGAPVWITGSSWAADEEILFPFFRETLPDHWRIILAPHEIGEENMARIEQECGLSTIRYSRLVSAPETAPAARLLIIDNIGILSALYRYGRIAYIGGGFGRAIHNLLEPIAFGLPVIFGPRHEKFQEALALKASGGGFAIDDRAGLEAVFLQLQSEEIYRKAARQAYGYLEQSKGSTEQILHYIHSNFDLSGKR